eukprot:10083343-Alexandrium_andersonii.AAC.1
MPTLSPLPLRCSESASAEDLQPQSWVPKAPRFAWAPALGSAVWGGWRRFQAAARAAWPAGRGGIAALEHQCCSWSTRCGLTSQANAAPMLLAS